jgi:hypothetical protein
MEFFTMSMPYPNRSDAILRVSQLAKNVPFDTPASRLRKLEQRYVHDDAIIAVVPPLYRSAMLTHIRSLLVRHSVGGAL